MGKTQSIEREAQRSKEFSNYLDTLRERLKANITTNFTENYNAFYAKNGYDHHTLASDMKWDFRQQDTFEPSRITNLIADSVNGIIGKPGEGSIAAGIRAIVLHRNVVVAVASSFVLSAMKLFNTSIAINAYQEYVDAPVCPGVTLHMLSFADSYQNKDYFNNGVIIETGVQYELTYSAAKARVETGMEVMGSLVEQIIDLNASVNAIIKEINRGAIDMPMKELQELYNRCKFFKSILKDTMQEIAQAGGPVEAVVAATALEDITASGASIELPSGLPADKLEICQSFIALGAQPLF